MPKTFHKLEICEFVGKSLSFSIALDVTKFGLFQPAPLCIVAEPASTHCQARI